MKQSRAAVTRDSILDAAERLFARQGHDNTSMRQITSDAGVNLSAVNYHFGSKDGLVRAVFQRRLAALNDERRQRLNDLEAQAQGAPLKPSQIVEAYFEPLVRHAYRNGQHETPFVPLVERSMSDPNGFIRALFVREHADVIDRFRLALQRALPNVTEDHILWRFHFMLGATSYAIMGADALRTALGLPEDTRNAAPDTKELMQRLLSFLLGGLRAPLPGQPGAGCSNSPPAQSPAVTIVHGAAAAMPAVAASAPITAPPAVPVITTAATAALARTPENPS